MNPTSMLLFRMTLLSLVCAGCVGQESRAESDLPIVTAVQRSVSHANADKVDWTEYTVRSAAVYANGRTSKIDRASTDDFGLSILRKLDGKRYWEVCYGTSVQGLVGASYCYYLDSTSYELLAKYNVK
jgi:hypothetical protein